MSLIYSIPGSDVVSAARQHEQALPSDDDIFAAARRHEERRKQEGFHQYASGFPLLQDNQPIAWVKYVGSPTLLIEEAATQEYVYEKLMQQPNVSELVRVPRVYRVIERDIENGSGRHNRTYVLIVMEFVPGLTVQRWLEKSPENKRLLWPRVLDALKTLLAFQPPEPIPPPGPVGGGRIGHLVFGEYFEREIAPRDFDSVEDLQNYINQTTEKRNLVADFASEDFRLCFCDPHQSNFMLADAEGVGPIYIIDFAHCLWLPISFLQWVLVEAPHDDIFEYLNWGLKLPSSKTNHKALSFFNSQQGGNRKYNRFK